MLRVRVYIRVLCVCFILCSTKATVGKERMGRRRCAFVLIGWSVVGGRLASAWHLGLAVPVARCRGSCTLAAGWDPGQVCPAANFACVRVGTWYRCCTTHSAEHYFSTHTTETNLKISLSPQAHQVHSQGARAGRRRPCQKFLRKKERKQTTQGRDGRTARRHHTGILRRGV